MPPSRNPFYIRTAEQAESDDQFLSLFGQSVLDRLHEDGSWNRFLSIESPPGSGKSTLLRLFTPTSLNNIFRLRNNQELSPLVGNLTAIDALDNDGVQVLGVLVNCREDYSRLADLHFTTDMHMALFNALLQVRLALLTLRSALQLLGHNYPHDVHMIRFEPRSESVGRRPDARVIEGRDLFERARTIEAAIVNSLNSFALQPPLPGQHLIFDDFLQILNSHRLIMDDKEVCRHLLLMFDDAQALEGSQRELLIEELLRHDRSAFASWMAMRLRALAPRTLVSDEARSPGRESHKSRLFEDWPRVQIENWLIDVGDRRAKRAQHEVSSLQAFLIDDVNVEFDDSKLTAVASAEREFTYSLARPHGDLYQSWLAEAEAPVSDMSPLERAIHWAQMSVLIERRIRRGQAEFNFLPLAPIDFGRAVSGTHQAAKMFLSKRNKLPYFYGTKTVARLASGNVDQFLSLCAVLFDRLQNRRNLRPRHVNELLPSEQHRLIVSESRTYIDGLRTNIPFGHDVYNLVTAIGKLGKQISSQPNVPIPPAVTGVSIQMSERHELIHAAQSADGDARRLLNTLASAIAHNALSMKITSRQRDEDRMVLYLNRLVCPAYDLPIGYGGYRPKKLSELKRCVDTGQFSLQTQLYFQ